MADVPVALARALADRYHLERPLGRGGTATVYLAHDARHHRPVALKVLRPELAAALGAERFLREIRIAAQVSHPHILSLHDSGSAGGFLYYVMPFVDGESLRDRLVREGQQSLEVTVSIAHDVADALGYAHSRGIVHRDIKPENILLSGEHALVADFGIARAIVTSGDERITETGIAVGTPAYMSPEQCSGAPVDGRTDVYALACVVYEMLLGAPPFTGPTAQVVMARHALDPVPPLRTGRRAVPPHVEAAVLKGLEKSPADRFATVAEFVAALSASPTPAPVQRSRRRLVVAAGITMAVVGLAAAGFAWFSYTGRPGTLIGENAFERGDRLMLGDFLNRTDDTSLAVAVREALRTTLDDPRLVRLVDESQVRETLERMGRPLSSTLDNAVSREVAERTEAKLFVTGEITRLGTGFQFIARILGLDGKELRVERVTARAGDDVIAAVDELGAKLRRDIGESLRAALQRPPLYQATSRSLPAIRALSDAVRAEYYGGPGDPVALARQAVALDTGFATAYMQLFVILEDHGFEDESQRAIEHAYRLRMGLPDVERLPIEWTYHQSNDDFTAAETALQEMLDLDPENTFAMQNLAYVRNGQRRFAEAESLALRAAAIDIRDVGHGDFLQYYNALVAQLAQGRLQAADSLVARIPNIPGRGGSLRRLGLGVALGERDWVSALAWADSGFVGPGARGRMQILYDMMHGRMRAAERAWGADVRSWAPLTVLRYSGDTARALRLLASWQRSVGWDTVPAARRDYVEPIAVNAEAGRIGEARRLLKEWQHSPNRQSLRWDEESGIGAIARAEGQVDSAVAAYLAWNRAPPADRVQNQGLAEAGMALDRAGRADSAVALYERALAVRNLGSAASELPWYPVVLYRLGALHESLGHRGRAIDYYSKFAELWKDADPELQPRVQQARRHLTELLAAQSRTGN